MNENIAMADAFFGIFGLRRKTMKKRDAEKDLKYANTVLEEYIPTDGFEEVMIARHRIPRAVKAEKKAKERKETIALNGTYDREQDRAVKNAILSEMHKTTFHANLAALCHRLAKKLNGPMLYEKPQGQWLKGTPEIFGHYHRRGHLYWGVYYWANDGYWRDSRSTNALADAVPYARYYSIPIEIPPMQEETNED